MSTRPLVPGRSSGLLAIIGHPRRVLEGPIWDSVRQREPCLSHGRYPAFDVRCLTELDMDAVVVSL
jgi:hypothetical protein